MAGSSRFLIYSMLLAGKKTSQNRQRVTVPRLQMMLFAASIAITRPTLFPFPSPL